MILNRSNNPRGCEGKMRYLKRATAKRAIRISKDLRGERGLGAYFCELCNCWHIGHLARRGG